MNRITPFARSTTSAATAGASVSSSIPAASTSSGAGEPVTATTSSAFLVSSGSARSRSPTRCSSESGTGSGCAGSSGAAPASSARASSSAKKGLPPDASCSRSRIGRGNLSPSRSRRRPWIAPTLSGPTDSRSTAPGSAGSSAAGASPRRARRILIGSRSSRRSANESAFADAGSSHWTSSIASTSAPRFGQLDQRVVHRRPRRRAGRRRDRPPPRAEALPRALVGAAPKAPAAPPRRRPRAGRRARRTRVPARTRRPRREHRRPRSRAASTPASQSVDLPIPASPSSTRAPGTTPVPRPARRSPATRRLRPPDQRSLLPSRVMLTRDDDDFDRLGANPPCSGRLERRSEVGVVRAARAAASTSAASRVVGGSNVTDGNGARDGRARRQGPATLRATAFGPATSRTRSGSAFAEAADDAATFVVCRRLKRRARKDAPPSRSSEAAVVLRGRVDPERRSRRAGHEVRRPEVNVHRPQVAGRVDRSPRSRNVSPGPYVRP